jgi:hypothetical protein
LYSYGLRSQADYLGDFYSFDIVSASWTDLGSNVSGEPPSARSNHGFVSAHGKLFVMGGVNFGGKAENRCRESMAR